MAWKRKKSHWTRTIAGYDLTTVEANYLHEIADAFGLVNARCLQIANDALEIGAKQTGAKWGISQGRVHQIRYNTISRAVSTLKTIAKNGLTFRYDFQQQIH